MSKRNEYVEKALSWVGTKEGSKGHKQIVADYNKACDKGRKADINSLWCAMFVGAVAQETGNALSGNIGVPVDYSCGTGAHSLIEKAKAAGIWVERDDYNPIIGDVIIYDWHDSNPPADDIKGHDHCGIITKAGNPFTVTEGNKNDAVGNRSVKVNAKNIRGFITPRFADEIDPPTPAPTPTPTPAPAPQAEPYKVTTNGSNLRLRVAPNDKAAVLASMPNGSRVTVTAHQNGWNRTTYKGQTGWAFAKWMTKI
jgi:hypothetical protein